MPPRSIYEVITRIYLETPCVEPFSVIPCDADDVANQHLAAQQAWWAEPAYGRSYTYMHLMCHAETPADARVLAEEICFMQRARILSWAHRTTQDIFADYQGEYDRDGETPRAIRHALTFLATLPEAGRHPTRIAVAPPPPLHDGRVILIWTWGTKELVVWIRDDTDTYSYLLVTGIAESTLEEQCVPITEPLPPCIIDRLQVPPQEDALV